MSLVIFQITALMCFIFALKIKMYQKNLVGFITIVTIFGSIFLSYLTDEFESVHYLLVSVLLIFIVMSHLQIAINNPQFKLNQI